MGSSPEESSLQCLSTGKFLSMFVRSQLYMDSRFEESGAQQSVGGSCFSETRFLATEPRGPADIGFVMQLAAVMSCQGGRMVTQAK